VSSQPQYAVAQPRRQPPSLSVGFADSLAEVREAQRLRYQVFARELGAHLHTQLPGLDYDPFDPHCEHLLVRDNVTGQVVGCTRLLTDRQAQQAGGFYSQTEFDLSRILTLPGRFVEVGRTCIHPDYRNGTTIATLWTGLAGFIAEHGFDYFIGCPSIPLGAGYRQAHATYVALAARYRLPEAQRVTPLIPLPPPEGPVDLFKPALPPLLKAYLRLGARIGGEPCLDADFGVADLFILLPTRDIERRYARHFLEQTP
jgi:putative hemolysin